MNKLLYIAQNPPTSYVYVGLADDPANVQEVLQDSSSLLRGAIDPTNENLMYVAGTTGIAYKGFYSTNGGQTWSLMGMGALGGQSGVRQLLVDSGRLYVLGSGILARSTNNGVAWTNITPGGMTDMADVLMLSGTGLLIRNFVSGASGCDLYRSVDNGTTWGLVQSFSALSGWQVGESGRRIICTGNLNTVWLLTSHNLWKLTLSGPSYTGTIVWNFASDIVAAYPQLNILTNTGYQGASDVYGAFDDLFVNAAETHLWLGGYSNLRAHSFNGGTSFNLTDPSVIPSIFVPTKFYSHWFRDVANGVTCSSDDPPPIVPLKPALHYSSNGGLTLSAVNFPAKRKGLHVTGLFSPVNYGCTDPIACNYDAAAQADDGTCNKAVTLTNCSDNADLLTCSNPEIAALGCRPPREMFNIQAAADVQDVSISLTINGVFQFTYGQSISLAQTAQERTTQFIQGLIAYINANTVFSAYPVPVAQNTLLPGSVNGIWIQAPDNTYANAQVAWLSFSINGLTFENVFDAGSAGSIVKLAEFPNNCYKVCGPAECATAVYYTLQAFYPDCVSCEPAAAPTICQDCSTLVSVNGAKLIPSSTDEGIQCFVAGQFLNFSLLIPFPDRQGEVLTPVSTGQPCAAGLQATFVFSGNAVISFPVGSQVLADDGSSSVYTVATVSYDQAFDITTVVMEEVCQSANPVVSLTTFFDCDCSTRVIVTDMQSNATLFDQTFTCVNNVVNANFQVQIPQYSRYRVIIQSSDCVLTKTCTYFFGACEQYKVVETACHTHRIELVRPGNAPLTGATAAIVVTDLATGLQVLNEPAVPDTSFPVTFTGSADTVYLVEVTSSDGTSYVTEVIDLCDLKTCRSKLVTDLFCGTDDPCDSDCEKGERREQVRAELNRIGLLTWQVDAMIYDYRFAWSGEPTYGPERKTTLTNIARVISTIQKISKRCGVCNDTNTNTPCLDC